MLLFPWLELLFGLDIAASVSALISLIWFGHLFLCDLSMHYVDFHFWRKLSTSEGSLPTELICLLLKPWPPVAFALHVNGLSTVPPQSSSRFFGYSLSSPLIIFGMTCFCPSICDGPLFMPSVALIWVDSLPCWNYGMSDRRQQMSFCSITQKPWPCSSQTPLKL